MRKGNNMRDVELESLADLTMEFADRISRGPARLVLSPALRETVREGRLRFERHLAAQPGYIYGTTTAPGNRAKVELDSGDQGEQGSTLASFITPRPGIAGSWLPARTVRLALLARMVNALTGRGKLSLETTEAIGALLAVPPPEVPLEGMAGPGEVMALSWLLAPIGDRPLRSGEAMALVNGSPFASAIVADAALAGARQLKLAMHVFALSAEAARMPLGHCEPRLAEAWPDPYYAEALQSLDGLLRGGTAARLPFQAPVAWRIIPNILAVALRAVGDAHSVAAISLRSLKDNPTFVPDPRGPAQDRVVSSGGYHDHLAGRAVDTMNASWSDLCTLAVRQVSRLIGGTDLQLPHLLCPSKGDGVGTEYIAWTITASVERARQAAVPVTLSISQEDPGGNQSDVSEPAFICFSRHLAVAGALNECLAALTIASLLALRAGSVPVPPQLRAFVSDILPEGLQSSASGAAAEPLRAVTDRFRRHVEGEELSALLTLPVADAPA